MAKSILDILEAMINIVPKSQTELTETLKSLKTNYTNNGIGNSIDAANEIISVIRHYIGKPRYNWQRKIYIVIRDDSLYKQYIHTQLN